MLRILDSDQMRICDRLAVGNAPSPDYYMKKAAEGVFDCAVKHMNPARTLVAVGSGNNGGDGLLCAIMLHRAGYKCDVLYCGKNRAVSKEMERLLGEAKTACVDFVEAPDYPSYTLIIDAIFGIGFRGETDEAISKIITDVNASGVPVLSVDIPSGISADTGRISGVAIKANRTVTMQTYKVGLLKGSGIDYCGIVSVVKLGIDTDLIEDDTAYALEESDLALIPKRERSSHKGTFGRVLVIASSAGMCGAAYLSALAAYRSGAGIVEIFCPEENRVPLHVLLPEAIITSYDAESFDSSLLDSALERATCVVIGPGLGKSSTSRRIVRETYEKVYSPIIIDADALNITAEEILTYPADVPVIVTPHPGEMARLIGQSVSDVARDPVYVTKRYATEHDVICVTKFARTVISDGQNVFINASGGPALSKGGSGDVLTGVIAGMLCADLSPIGAATLGVYVHGAAGDKVAQRLGEYSPLAREVADAVAEVIK